MRYTKKQLEIITKDREKTALTCPSCGKPFALLQSRNAVGFRDVVANFLELINFGLITAGPAEDFIKGFENGLVLTASEEARLGIKRTYDGIDSEED